MQGRTVVQMHVLIQPANSQNYGVKNYADK